MADGPARAGPMVRLTVVPGRFEAQVLAARLGAAGVLWQLRGNVGGPYPMGPVEVLVAEPDVALARELLLLDDLEAAFGSPSPWGGDDGGDDDAGDEDADEAWPRDRHRRRVRVLGALGAAVVAGGLVLRVVEGVGG